MLLLIREPHIREGLARIGRFLKCWGSGITFCINVKGKAPKLANNSPTFRATVLNDLHHPGRESDDVNDSSWLKRDPLQGLLPHKPPPVNKIHNASNRPSSSANSMLDSDVFNFNIVDTKRTRAIRWCSIGFGLKIYNGFG